MRARLSIVAVFLASAVAAAQRADVTSVSIHVVVEDENQAPVNRLPAAEFSVAVDGVVRPVMSVAPATAPLSVLLLLDDSRSMLRFGQRLEPMAEMFVGTLAATDRVRTGVFGDRILFAPAFSSARSSFRLVPRNPIVVRERRVKGGSPIWDAIRDSVELLAEEQGRRILLVFSDGRASGNWHGLEDVAEFTVDHAVAIYAMAPFATRQIRQDRTTVAMVRPAANLDRLTLYSGGLLVGGYDSKVDPLKRLRTLASTLRAGYALRFEAPADNRRHRLDVAVALPGARVRAPMAIRR